MAACCGSNPGCRLSACCKLRTTSTLPISSTTDRATCAVTRMSRRLTRRSFSEGASFLMAPARVARVDCSAGTSPNSRPVNKRNSGREQEHARVHHDVRNHRDVDGRTPGVDQVGEPEREQNSRGAASDRQHHAFGEKLADQIVRGWRLERAGWRYLFYGRRRGRAEGWQDSRRRSAAPCRRRP